MKIIIFGVWCLSQALGPFVDCASHEGGYGGHFMVEGADGFFYEGF
jgi:hypothetical protein